MYMTLYIVLVLVFVLVATSSYCYSDEEIDRVVNKIKTKEN